MNNVGRRQAVKLTAIIGAVAAGALVLEPPSARTADDERLNERLSIAQVRADSRSLRGNQMSFFVRTGSDSPPIVCLAENNGFPQVREVYAKGGTRQERLGVFVTLIFAEAPRVGPNNHVAINLLQAKMTGDFAVSPLNPGDGKKDAALPVLSAPNPPALKVPKELLQKRIEAARKVFQENTARIQNREGLPAELFGWSERWLKAELALCDKESERVRALRDHLDRTREVERITAAFARAGQGRQADADAATYDRLEAEIRLFKEGVEPHPAKGPKEKREKP